MAHDRTRDAVDVRRTLTRPARGLDAPQTRGRVLFVAGEAGIGKSRLAQETIVRARLGRFRVPALP